MGGGGGIGNIFKDIGAAALAIPTGGASLAMGPDTKSSGLNPLKAISPMVGNLTGATAAKSAADAQRQALMQQANQAAAMQKELLLQPKTTSPDNFLSMKNRQLQNLRLGLASTITGGGAGGGGVGAPSPVLSSPSLSAGGGKTKYGA